MIDEEDRLLMSDSLVGMIPELEEGKIKDIDDALLVVAFELIYENLDEVDVLAGRTEGISFESTSEIKVDMRVQLNKAYDTIKKFKTTGLSCRMLHLYLGDDELNIEGPFKVANTKLFNFDIENKMCTLGFDLVKFDNI